MLSYGSTDATPPVDFLLTDADHTEIARCNALAKVLFSDVPAIIHLPIGPLSAPDAPIPPPETTMLSIAHPGTTPDWFSSLANMETQHNSNPVQDEESPL